MTIRLKCPACGSPASVEAHEVNGFAIRKCRQCKSLYVRDVPNRAALDEIYADAGYYELDEQSARRIWREHERRMRILRGLSVPGRILDVGCATGLLLDKAAEAGYETFGVELSRKNAAIASGKGHAVFVGTLADYTSSNSSERFPLITCLDVIEHVEAPLEFMEMLSSHLSPGGLLVMSTPNYSGLVAKVLGKRDVFMTPPEHLNFFTVNGLSALAGSARLAPVYATTFGRLTRDELDRAVSRYFSKLVLPARHVLRAGIQTGFAALNIVRVGLEMEMYFRKVEAK